MKRGAIICLAVAVVLMGFVYWLDRNDPAPSYTALTYVRECSIVTSIFFVVLFVPYCMLSRVGGLLNRTDKTKEK